MRSDRPGRPARRRELGLLWACAVSGLAHAGLLAIILLRPGHLPVAPPLLQSYTVDLVSADVLGGDSGPILGPRGAGLLSRAAAAPEPPPPPAAEPEPPAAEPEVAEIEPEPVVADASEQLPAEAPPPVRSDDRDDAIALGPKATEVPPTATPQQIAPTATRAAPPTVAAPTAAPPTAKPTPRPTAPAKPTVAKSPTPVAKTPAAKATPSAKATPVGKATPTAKGEGRTPAAKPTARSAVASAVKTPAAASAVKTPAVVPTLTLDQQIAEAVKRRAQAAGGGTSETDRKIADAVSRRAKQVEAGSGGGTESGEGGAGSTTLGPLGSGPGSGSGGAVRGIEYILYKRTMEERIRGAWAWAGTDDSLECVVRFSVAPGGEISEIRTTRSSGDPAYDNSAERAVRAVNPLRPIPDDYRNEFGDVELTFRARDLKH